MKLVIVESPTKAKTLSRFLGKEYKIEASMGHIRDLPKSKLGVDTEKDFKPDYALVKGKGKVVKLLKSAAKGKDEIILATDQDREGEALVRGCGDTVPAPCGRGASPFYPRAGESQPR